MKRICLIALAWCAATAPADALAHGQLPGGIAPFFEEGEFIGGGTTYGLVWLGDLGPELTCGGAPEPPSR